MAVYTLGGAANASPKDKDATSLFYAYGSNGEVCFTSDFWETPSQSASVRKPWSYAELIAKYDELVAANPGYITKHEYQTQTDTGYTLYHYEFVPENYQKTIYLQAGVHGNEMDAKQTLLRICQIIANETDQVKYGAFREIRKKARIIVVPCISPYGHDHSSMNIPYTYNGEEVTAGLNANRNYDYVHQYAIPQAGVGGDSIWCVAETQHVRDLINSIGAENIDFAIDFHDGEDVQKHWWINYPCDSTYKDVVVGLLAHLNDKYNVENPVMPDCKDTTTTGTAAGYFGHSLGIAGGVCEWIGGIFGYDFSQKQMTMSLDVRGNLIIKAFLSDVKGWKINESTNAQYWHWDFPKSLTSKYLRKDGTEDRSKVTDAMIYERWDALAAKYPSYITKSERLGYDVTGTQGIYTYTLGSGSKKVLYVGGVMRFGGTHKIDEYTMYLIAEYLCNSYIVNQSPLMQRLKQDYTIVVLPFIDNIAANNSTQRDAGLNNTCVDRQKWTITDNKTVPTDFALTVHDVPIIKSLIDGNTGLKCIVSGGEIMSGYSLNPPDYTTDYETQIVIPKNAQISSAANAYANHLTTDRNEDVSIENTQGYTFGDYAYDQYGIPVYFVQLKTSKKWTELADYHTQTEEDYQYLNYETGRRMANIINLFLCH